MESFSKQHFHKLLPMQGLAINLKGWSSHQNNNRHKEFIYTWTNVCDVVEGLWKGLTYLLITHELSSIEFHYIQIQGDKIIQPIFKNFFYPPFFHLLNFLLAMVNIKLVKVTITWNIVPLICCGRSELMGNINILLILS
jgi:hypothetical protein